MARTKEEREQLRAELEQEEKDEAEKGSSSKSRADNYHLDLTEAVRDKILTREEARKLLGMEDESDNGDGDDDDDGKPPPKEKAPRRRAGYFDQGKDE